MKVGDKLICKKDFGMVTLSGCFQAQDIFKVGKEYTIDYQAYRSDCVLIRSNIGLLWFDTINKPIGYYIWEYFWEPNDLRKEKLKKLDESRR